jgi:exoribonuclease R
LRAADARSTSPYTDDELIAIAARCTERGEAARKVERTMRKIAGASMLSERIGESFAAIVTASSPKGVYARVLSPPVEGRIVKGGAGLDVGDTVRLTLVVADAVRGHIDFAHESPDDDTARKRERSRRKKLAADVMKPRIGETFQAEVTGVSSSGTWVRLVDGTAEGRVMRGFKTLTVGMKVPVKLIDADTVLIDFAYVEGTAPEKEERLERKRAAALGLRDRIGETFRATVTGTTSRATWVVLADGGVEGRLVRGRKGLSVGDEIGVILLTADPVRGFIDFARET